MRKDNREDFPLPIKKALAERAGFRCSFPGCGAPTVGPSDESDDTSSNVGMACHIVAAASGINARRVDLNMSRNERVAINNGIWMCYTHGKLIDTDENRFTVEMLKKWREMNELRAKLSVEAGRNIELTPNDVLTTRFASNQIVLQQVGGENGIIGDAIRDSCVAIIWGAEESRTVRDAVIELTRNAFQHGSAKTVHLNINDRLIQIQEDGQEFDISSLPTHPLGRGGSVAIKFLIDKYSDKLILSSRRVGNINEVTIALVETVADVRNATPCVVTVTHEQIRKGSDMIRVHETCKSVYLILSQYFSISDVYLLAKLLEQRGPDSRQYYFVAEDISAQVCGLFATLFPGHKLIQVVGEERCNWPRGMGHLPIT